MQEYTFSMIKPDITQRNLIGAVNRILEDSDLKIVAQRMVILSRDQAKKFYAEHQERSFFNQLIDMITSGPVVLQVLKGENAILKNREIMGATNPSEAKDSTIRMLFGQNIENNSIHGSDSIESAKREIAFFFAKSEIYG
ncbi:MAG: nucleoside-diphosphate kinase [Rickettsiaceae bacterium]